MIYYGTKTLNEWKPNLSERKRKQFEQSKEATYVIISSSNETNGHRIYLDIGSKYCFEERKAHFTETKASH